MQLCLNVQQEAPVHAKPLEAKLPGRTHYVVTVHSSLALPGAIGWCVAPGLQPPSAEQAAAAACGSELWRHQGQEGKWLDARVARAAGGQAGVSRGGTAIL